jgi:hypothetical protein
MNADKHLAFHQRESVFIGGYFSSVFSGAKRNAAELMQ